MGDWETVKDGRYYTTSRSTPWSDEATRRLVELEKTGMTSEDIAGTLGCSLEAVSSQLSKLGIRRENARSYRKNCVRWEDWEEKRAIDLLLSIKEGDTFSGLAHILSKETGRSLVSAKGKLGKLREKGYGPSVEAPRRWTAEEDAVLADLFYRGVSPKNIASMVGLTESVITHRVGVLQSRGLLGYRYSTDGKNEHWTNEEVEYLVTHLKREGISGVARKLNRSVVAVRRMAVKLKSSGVTFQ